MLGSIEKGRKLPQFGRRHNVAFFNKMHPLSRLAQCNPTEHFIVFCHLTLPAREVGWHSVPEVTKSLCVHTGFHIPQRVRGESCFVIFLKSCHKRSLTGAQKVWAKTAGAGWRQKCHMPTGVGAGWQKVILYEGIQWGQSPVAGRDTHFSGDQQTSVTGRVRRFRQGGGQRMGHKNRSQKPLDASASSRGLQWLPQCSSQSSGRFSLWENIFLSALPCIS